MQIFFVTGNLGYIGPILAKQLKTQVPDCLLIGLDNGYFKNSSISPTFLEGSPLYDIQYFGDVRNSVLLKSIFLTHAINHVIHLAAISNDPMGQEFESVTHDINCLSTTSLAKLSISHFCDSFVFASSCSVYGKGSATPRSEKDSVDPLTAYAKSKIHSEIALKELVELSTSTKLTCLRFATACGFSPMLRLDLVLNDFVATAQSTQSITLKSDGSPWRPLIDVEDMAKALHWASVRNTGLQYEVYNTGGLFSNYQVIYLAEHVSSFFPFDVKLVINSQAPQDDRSYKVNFEKLHACMPDSFKPSIKLPTSIDRLAAGMAPFLPYVDPSNRSHLIRLSTLRCLKSLSFVDAALNWLK
jgi:UDP-glucose 4-epimerase